MKAAANPLVPLGSARGGAPILCIPGAGASVTSYLEFVGALGDHVPVYGLQPRGMDLLEPADVSVEASSACYLEAVRAARLDGPIHLVGHSHGGKVAFDMALRMRGEGREVRSLTLIDSEAPLQPGHLEHIPTDAEVFRDFVDVFEKTHDVQLQVPEQFVAGGSRESFAAALHVELVRTRCLSARSSFEPVLGSLIAFTAAMKSQYVAPAPFAGHVALVLVDERGESDEQGKLRKASLCADWRRSAPDLVAWQCSGDHFSVLRAPHVQRLAAWWTRMSHRPESNPVRNAAAFSSTEP